MNAIEQFRYLRALEREFGRRPESIFVFYGTSLLSQPDTAGEKAFQGASWIDYWRAVVNCTRNDMLCARCGKKIYAHLPQGIDADRQAHGGHVLKVEIEPLHSFRLKSYIVPLCPACNNPANTNWFKTQTITALAETITG